MTFQRFLNDQGISLPDGANQVELRRVVVDGLRKIEWDTKSWVREARLAYEWISPTITKHTGITLSCRELYEFATGDTLEEITERRWHRSGDMKKGCEYSLPIHNTNQPKIVSSDVLLGEMKAGFDRSKSNECSWKYRCFKCSERNTLDDRKCQRCGADAPESASKRRRSLQGGILSQVPNSLALTLVIIVPISGLVILNTYFDEPKTRPSIVTPSNTISIYDSALARRLAVDQAVSESANPVRVNNITEAPRLESILRDAGWRTPTVTEGIKLRTPDGYRFRVEVIDSSSQDWYVVIDTSADMSRGQILMKSRESPW